jgi:tyrosyl-tRNA synthetase
MGTGEGEGVNRRGQEEDQAMRIIERLRKLKKGAEERQQAYNTMEQYFEELGKKLTNDEIQKSFANAISDLAGGMQEAGIIRCREHPHANGYGGKYKETTTTFINNSNKKKHPLYCVLKCCWSCSCF